MRYLSVVEPDYPRYDGDHDITLSGIGLYGGHCIGASGLVYRVVGLHLANRTLAAAVGATAVVANPQSVALVSSAPGSAALAASCWL
jgi:hypothetical protein